MEDPLTDKEAKDLLPVMNQVFVTLFKYADMGITLTNKDRAEAKIWSMIDDDDISILVEVLIGGAKESRLLATGVRKVSKSYKMMRFGLITFPRFMETYRFYQEHGFGIPMGGKVVASQ